MYYVTPTRHLDCTTTLHFQCSHVILPLKCIRNITLQCTGLGCITIQILFHSVAVARYFKWRVLSYSVLYIIILQCSKVKTPIALLGRVPAVQWRMVTLRIHFQSVPDSTYTLPLVGRLVCHWVCVDSQSSGYTMPTYA